MTLLTDTRMETGHHRIPDGRQEIPRGNVNQARSRRFRLERRREFRMKRRKARLTDVAFEEHHVS